MPIKEESIEKIKEINSLIDEGLTPKHAIKKIGIAAPYYYQTRKKINLFPKRKLITNSDPERPREKIYENISELIKEGLSQNEACRKYDIPYTSYISWKFRNKYKINKPKKRQVDINGSTTKMITLPVPEIHHDTSLDHALLTIQAMANLIKDLGERK